VLESWSMVLMKRKVYAGIACCGWHGVQRSADQGRIVLQRSGQLLGQELRFEFR